MVDDGSDAQANQHHRRRDGIPVLRALAVLVLFVAATLVALGQLHPSSSPSATSAGSSSTTSTTVAPSTTTTHAQSRVPVLVANASGVAGAAASITNQLQVGGWNMQTPVNASARVPSSHVYYLAGQQQAATAVAASLHLPSSAVVPYTTAAPVSSIGTAGVVVVVGPDLATPVGSVTTLPSHPSGT